MPDDPHTRDVCVKLRVALHVVKPVYQYCNVDLRLLCRLEQSYEKLIN